MIKVIISDMDGTLFYGHGRTIFDLTHRNELALKRCQKHNVSFFVASGRTVGYGQRLLQKYGFANEIVGGFNGAVCVDNGIDRKSVV